MSAIASRKNILILSFTLLVVMLGYGMIQPIIPFLITSLGASGKDMGLLASVYASMQLVCAPFWGTLSDRMGRKPVLLIGVLGYAIAIFIFGLSTRFWMLFVARTFSGVLSSATMPTAMAYLSDNLPEKERGSAMGKLGAAVGLGVVLGPLLGGFHLRCEHHLPIYQRCGNAFDRVCIQPIGTTPGKSRSGEPSCRSYWHEINMGQITSCNCIRPLLDLLTASLAYNLVIIGGKQPCAVRSQM